MGKDFGEKFRETKGIGDGCVRGVRRRKVRGLRVIKVG